MYKSKFNTLLRTLNTSEVQNFEKYVRRRTHDRTTLKVFDYIIKAEGAKKLELSYLYRVLFHDRQPLLPAKRKNLLNLLYDLHSYLQEFLIMEKLHSSIFEKKALWLDILEERKLMEEFAKQTDRLYQELKNKSVYSMKDLWQTVAADGIKHRYLALNPASFDSLDFMHSQLENLELYTLTLKLKAACEILTQQRLAPDIPIKALPDIPERLPDFEAVAQIPISTLYWHLYQLLRPEPTVDYHQVLFLIEQNAARIEPVELYEIIKYIYNYNALLIRKGGELAVAQQLHDINKFANSYDFFKQPGIITATQLNNIVNIACAVKDYEWANTFIETQGVLLPEPVRVLAQATVWFEQGRFDAVVYHLNQLSFRQIPDQLRAKMLVLRSYYCLEMPTNVISNFSDNFEKWLRRHKEKYPDSIKATMNFIPLFRTLLQGITRPEHLLKQIEDTSNLICRGWLQTQVQLRLP